jgi:hypothetical protein
MGFATDLQRELDKQDLSLSGQYPELKVSFFTLVLNFAASDVSIWYGPKQERLAKCSLWPREVASRLQEIKGKLGSQVPAEEFQEKLREAYQRNAPRFESRRVPIIQMLAEMAFQLQTSKFKTDPRADNYKGYGRADFSYDLFRMRHSLLDRGLRLVVASRSYAAHPQDFLWIPESESVSGTVYSHLTFKE